MSMKALLIPALIVLVVLATFATTFGDSIPGWTNLQNALSTNPFESLPQLPPIGGTGETAVLELSASANGSSRGAWRAVGLCTNATFYQCLIENDGNTATMAYIAEVSVTNTVEVDPANAPPNYFAGKTITQISVSIACQFTMKNPGVGNIWEVNIVLTIVGTSTDFQGKFLCTNTAYRVVTVTWPVRFDTGAAWTEQIINNDVRIGCNVDYTSGEATSGTELFRCTQALLYVFTQKTSCTDFIDCFTGGLQKAVNVLVFLATGLYTVIAGIVLSIIWGTTIVIMFFSAVIETAGFMITIGNTAPLLISIILGGVFVVLMAIVFFAGVEYLSALRGGGI